MKLPVELERMKADVRKIDIQVKSAFLKVGNRPTVYITLQTNFQETELVHTANIIKIGTEETERQEAL